LDIVICPYCEEILKKKPLKDNEAAFCPVCGHRLYSSVSFIEYKIFLFSLVSLSFFLVYLVYPIVGVDILGEKGEFNILETVEILINRGYLVVGGFTLFSVVIFPFLLVFSYFCYGVGLLFRKKFRFFLGMIGILKEWVMVDIMVVAILVSLVKVMDYGEIIVGVGFWGMVIFFVMLIYINYYLKTENLWSVDV